MHFAGGFALPPPIGHTEGTLSVMSTPRRRRQPGVTGGHGEDPFVVEDVQGAWRLQTHVELQRGVPIVTELRLHPVDARSMPAGGVTSGVLRSLNFVALRDAIRRACGSAEQGPPSYLDVDGASLPDRHPGRKGHPDALYAIWAARYIEMCKTTSRPYPALVEKYPNHTARYISGLVEEAHRRKLIVREGSRSGRAGGRLTAKAEKVISGLRIGLVPGTPVKKDKKGDTP